MTLRSSEQAFVRPVNLPGRKAQAESVTHDPPICDRDAAFHPQQNSRRARRRIAKHEQLGATSKGGATGVTRRGTQGVELAREATYRVIPHDGDRSRQSPRHTGVVERREATDQETRRAPWNKHRVRGAGQDMRRRHGAIDSHETRWAQAPRYRHGKWRREDRPGSGRGGATTTRASQSQHEQRGRGVQPAVRAHGTPKRAGSI